MNQNRAPALAGVLKVVFFLAAASLAVTAVAIGVTTLYEAPSGEETEFGEFEGFEGFVIEQDKETADYNRNVGLILSFIGIGAIALGLLGLGSRFNPLRAGLLAGGVGLVFVGVAQGSGGSNDWLTFLTSGLAFLTLAACSPWLDEGLPLHLLAGGTSSGTAGGATGAGVGPDPG
jgi:hypothetical protein